MRFDLSPACQQGQPSAWKCWDIPSQCTSCGRNLRHPRVVFDQVSSVFFPVLMYRLLGLRWMIMIGYAANVTTELLESWATSSMESNSNIRASPCSPPDSSIPVSRASDSWEAGGISRTATDTSSWPTVLDISEGTPRFRAKVRTFSALQFASLLLKHVSRLRFGGEAEL
jgi:hypothetical protein